MSKYTQTHTPVSVHIYAHIHPYMHVLIFLTFSSLSSPLPCLPPLSFPYSSYPLIIISFYILTSPRVSLLLFSSLLPSLYLYSHFSSNHSTIYIDFCKPSFLFFWSLFINVQTFFFPVFFKVSENTWKKIYTFISYKTKHSY